MNSLAHLPGPRGIPFLGNIHQLDQRRFHHLLRGWADDFGGLYQFRIGRKPFFVFSDPEAILEILKKRPGDFRRMRSIETSFLELGLVGVFSAEGETWRKHRRLTQPAFHQGSLKDFFSTLMEITLRMKGRFDRLMQNSDDIEIGNELARFTVDVTTRLAFDYDMNTIENEDDQIQALIKPILPVFSKRVTAAFRYWNYFKLPADRRLDRSLVRLRTYIEEMIVSRKSTSKSLLRSFVDYRDEEGGQLNASEVFGNILTVLIAGEDTTASTLAWTLHFMTEYPLVQRRMTQEALTLLPSGFSGAVFEDLSRCPFIESVLMEAMRLKPVAPFLFQETNRECTVQGTPLPQGTQVIAFTSYGNFQEKYFTDALSFRPERWIDSERPASWNHDLSAFMPFGGGARVCPGRSLSMIEMKVFMLMFCLHFESHPPRNKKIPKDEFHFVTLPVGLWLRLSQRM